MRPLHAELAVAAVLLLAVAACGHAEDPPTPPPAIKPIPYGSLICTQVIDGHKFTFYCDEQGRPI